MPRMLMTMVLSLFPSLALAAGSAAGAAAGHGFACDMRALTNEQRTQHAELAQALFAAVQERKELPNGYAFRLPAARWLDAARWSELESKCCPFFSFELAAAADRGPVWLKVTGRAGAKAFMKDEFGL
jgi:hypothetical protein